MADDLEDYSNSVKEDDRELKMQVVVWGESIGFGSWIGLLLRRRRRSMDVFSMGLGPQVQFNIDPSLCQRAAGGLQPLGSLREYLTRRSTPQQQKEEETFSSGVRCCIPHLAKRKDGRRPALGK